MSSQPEGPTGRRTSCLLVVLLPLLAVLCLGALVGVNTAASLPQEAARAFGPPAPGLGGIQSYLISARLLLREEALNTAPDPLAGPQAFQVEFGESAGSIVESLVEAGLVEDGETFSLYLQYGGKDKTIQSGEYTFSRAMTPIQIAEGLQDATPAEVAFRVLSGWRMEEIAEALPTSGLEITPNQFLSAAYRDAQQYLSSVSIPDGASLEGFFAPGEYTIPRVETVGGFIQTLVAGFEDALDGEVLDAFARQGLSAFEAVTLASIVEREAVVNEEAPMIASVYLNRLAIGMKLDADPTVQYALGYNRPEGTWWTNPLSLRDLQVDSPFNTYLYSGLPPGPIASPGLDAIRAVAFPADTPYYYFRAACDGSGLHNFSTTFEEHLANSCKGDTDGS